MKQTVTVYSLYELDSLVQILEANELVKSYEITPLDPQPEGLSVILGCITRKPFATVEIEINCDI